MRFYLPQGCMHPRKAYLWLALLLLGGSLLPSAIVAQCTIPPNISYSGVAATYPLYMAISPLILSNTGGGNLTGGTGAFMVSTFAGSGTDGFANGIGIAAQFSYPNGVAADNAGNLYVADTYNNSIRKIVIATGVVTTLAGSGTGGFADDTGIAAQFNAPNGIAADNAGNLYVADKNNHRIRKIVIATGEVTTVAGAGTQGFVDDTGIVAEFNGPNDLTLDNAGNLYVADYYNHCIRKIVLATGEVSTLAGSGVAGFAEGTGTTAQFAYPSSVTADNTGNLYVASNFRIRKIVIATGVVTTLAGSTPGLNNGTGTAARFSYINDLILDNAGNLYVADLGNHRIRKIVIATGAVTTAAGSGPVEGFADGASTVAMFYNPSGLAIDNAGNLYVADEHNNRIRKLTPLPYAITPELPSGLAFNGATGEISGSTSFDTPNTTYTVTTQNACGSSSTTLSFATCEMPTITAQPTAATVCAGANASFTVAASSLSTVT